MMNYLKRTYPRTGNGEVITPFEKLKRAIRETDARRILPLLKITPPLETSISFQESGTTSSKKVSDDDFGVDDNPSGLYPRNATSEPPRGFQKGKVKKSLLVHENRCRTRRIQSIIIWLSSKPKHSPKKMSLGRIMYRRRETGLSGICISCYLWNSRVVQYGGVLRLGKRYFWMPNVGRDKFFIHKDSM